MADLLPVHQLSVNYSRMPGENDKTTALCPMGMHGMYASVLAELATLMQVHEHRHHR